MSNDADQSSPVKRLSQVCIDAAHQMVLFADLLGEMPAQLAGKKSRQPRAPDMPKYPKSSYILFSDDHRQETRKETKSGKASDVVTLLAQKWNALSDAEKQPYIIKAKEERKRYEMEMEAHCAKLAAESLGGEPVATTTATSSNDDSSHKSDGDDQSTNDDGDDSSDNGDSSDDDDTDDDDTSSSETDTESSDTGSSASQIIEAPQQVPPPQNVTNPKDAAAKMKESVVKPTEKATQLVINKDIVKHNIASKQLDKGKQPAKPIEKQPTKPNENQSAKSIEKQPAKPIENQFARSIEKQLAKYIEKHFTKPTGKRSHESSKRPSASTSYDPQSSKAKKPKQFRH
ncbi:hypothetical protein O0I10_011622 [Lichtheimia ornata]|uniref:HMG box domain-containing protein n=1 Tax=Lichtheimia ornata TaxID=688661 RepID=A0AAD7UUJ8_9FUNG|nr:uncharacterized protein O0I10_011622 [Lichtheimia ornata]KAJ8652740.1 hypothetical protein O0I10_011622 [Lichtheimia ornata]